MGVVRARIQTVEHLYRLVWTAIANKRPAEAPVPWTPSSILSAPIGAESGRATARAVLSIRRGERERTSAGGVANWRCLALEEVSRVKLLEDAWRTAPNHSRPASCAIDADIDAEDAKRGPTSLPEDQAEPEPQKGQQGS